MARSMIRIRKLGANCYEMTCPHWNEVHAYVDDFEGIMLEVACCPEEELPE